MLASTPSTVLRDFCSGAADDAHFYDRSGDEYLISRDQGLVRVLREMVTESGDWAIEDSYIFVATSGVRRQASRVVRYAEPPYRYVKIVDESGKSTDNIDALPDGWFIPEEPMLASQAELCRLKVK